MVGGGGDVDEWCLTDVEAMFCSAVTDIYLLFSVPSTLLHGIFVL